MNWTERWSIKIEQNSGGKFQNSGVILQSALSARYGSMTRANYFGGQENSIPPHIVSIEQKLSEGAGKSEYFPEFWVGFQGKI